MCAEKFLGPASCDCGDTEAWKGHVHCSLHLPTSKAYDVPIDMQQRAKHLFSMVLSHALDVLYHSSHTVNSSPELSSCFLRPTEDPQCRDDRYATIICCEDSSSVPDDLLDNLQIKASRSQIKIFPFMFIFQSTLGCWVLLSSFGILVVKY